MLDLEWCHEFDSGKVLEIGVLVVLGSIKSSSDGSVLLVHFVLEGRFVY